MTTQKLDSYNSYLLIILGILQFVATPIFFHKPEEPAFWFFNGGITLILLGLINLLRVRHGRMIGTLRKISIAANATVLVFWLAMLCALTYKFMRYPFAALPVAALCVALALSFFSTKNNNSTRQGENDNLPDTPTWH